MDASQDPVFRDFVAARYRSLLHFAHLLTGDLGHAEDLVQNALARTAASWARVQKKDEPEGYVRRAIINGSLNRWRRKPWREEPQAEMVNRPATSTALEALDERDAMWRALSELPHGQRTVLVLSRVASGTIATTLRYGLLR